MIQGAKLFWLDVAEPEYSVYDFKNYRYQLGSVQEVGKYLSEILSESVL